MHKCVGNLTIIGLDNGLLPGRCQAIIWTNARILLSGPLGTSFNEILIKICTFSFKKVHLKVLSAKWQPFCFGLNVLNILIHHNPPELERGHLLASVSRQLLNECVHRPRRPLQPPPRRCRVTPPRGPCDHGRRHYWPGAGGEEQTTFWFLYVYLKKKTIWLCTWFIFCQPLYYLQDIHRSQMDIERLECTHYICRTHDTWSPLQYKDATLLAYAFPL